MKIKKILKENISIITVIVILGSNIALSNYAIASDDEGIEISKSSLSETLGDIYTLGLFAPLTSKKYPNLHGGFQIIFFEKNNLGENDFTLKFYAGQEFGNTVALFYEAGTDFYGLITLLSDNKETHNCTNEQRCAIDTFLRIGLRIKLGNNLTLGVFHENIDFGDFHKNLSSEHRYVGSSIGFKF